MPGWDPDLDGVLEDPADRALARELSRVEGSMVEADHAFRSQLRRQLMEEAWRGAERRPWWRPGPRRAGAGPRLALTAAGLGALLIAVAVYSAIGHHPGGGTVVITPAFDTTHPTAAVLSFNQPMDEASVERAIQVSPATAVSYQWVSNNQVRIVPVAGSFAPNTQYQVSLAQDVARTATGTVVVQTQAALFTVAPTPTVVPIATPTPTPTAPPPALGPALTLAPAGPVAPGWSADGSTLVYQALGDRVLAIPAAGSAEPRTVVPEAAKWFAVSADHRRVITAGAAVQTAALDGGGPTTVSREAAVAVGWRGELPLYATDHDVVAGPNRVKLAQQLAPGGQGLFSPDGSALLYSAAGKLRLVDLTAGTDTEWPGGGSLLGWSPDSRSILTLTVEGIASWPRDGHSHVVLSQLQGVTAIAWLPGGRLLAAAGGTLQLIGGGQAQQLAGGGFDNLSAAPAGNAIAWVRAGQLMTATLTLPASGAQPDVSDAATAATVAAFMDARVAGNEGAATALLGEHARPLYAGHLLFTGDPRLGRWFTVYSSGSTVDVRLVLASGGRDVEQLDEQIAVTAGAGGRPLITNVSFSPVRSYGHAPEVLSVTTTDGRLRIEFDSDLDSTALAAGVVALGARPGTITADGRRAVLVDVSAGTPTELDVTTALRDTAGHSPATAWKLFLGPEAPAPGTASPPRS